MRLKESIAQLRDDLNAATARGFATVYVEINPLQDVVEHLEAIQTIKKASPDEDVDELTVTEAVEVTPKVSKTTVVVSECKTFTAGNVLYISINGDWYRQSLVSKGYGPPEGFKRTTVSENELIKALLV